MARPPRFIYGFLSQSTQPINMKIPWQISNQDGAFAMNYLEEEAMHTNLVCWAKTNWGERPMSFKFGLDAKRHLFDPAVYTADILKQNAREQLNEYFPTFQVSKLDILTSQEDESLIDNEIRFILEGQVNNTKKKNIKLNIKLGA